MSTNSSISCSETAGPRSLISVCSPVVGSITAVLVRDSSRMRTKSDSTESCVSWSTSRVPVAPPASPVAITGAPSVLSTRATLTPLPPGIVVCSTVRWRRPSRKFGTASVLSIAVLSVTVRIMRPPAPSGGCGGAAARGACRRATSTVPPSTTPASRSASGRVNQSLVRCGRSAAGTDAEDDDRHRRDPLAVGEHLALAEAAGRA